MLTATRRNFLATSTRQWMNIFSYQIAYSSELMKTDTRSSEIKNVSLSGIDVVSLPVPLSSLVFNRAFLVTRTPYE